MSITLSAYAKRTARERNRTTVRLGAALALAAALAVSPATGPANAAHADGELTYTRTPLTIPPPRNTAGFADGNARGEAVGTVFINPGWPYPAFASDTAVWRSDGSVTKVTVPLIGDGTPQLLNDHGVIAGQAGGEAYIWTDGVSTNLTPWARLQGWGTRPSAISDAGHVVVSRASTALSSSDKKLAFAIWKDGKLSPWMPAGGSSTSVVDISDSGVAVGTRMDPAIKVGSGPLTRAFTMTGDGKMNELPTPGWPVSRAVAINNRGQILGEVGRPSFHVMDEATIHTVLWEDGVMTDLGTLGGRGTEVEGTRSLNEQGQVVGKSDRATNGYPGYYMHAFIWQNGTMTDLGKLVEPPDASIPDGASMAHQINDAGQVYLTSGPLQSTRHLWRNGKLVQSPFGVTFLNENGRVIGGDGGGVASYTITF